jgi:hypothetical protein
MLSIIANGDNPRFVYSNSPLSARLAEQINQEWGYDLTVPGKQGGLF